jgi:hypothetical protein
VGSALSVAVTSFFQLFKILWDSTSREHFFSFTKLGVELKSFPVFSDTSVQDYNVLGLSVYFKLFNFPFHIFSLSLSLSFLSCIFQFISINLALIM